MIDSALQSGLVRIWWQVLLRGLISLALGLLMLIWPHASVQAYIWIFGVYTFADGLLLTLQTLAVRKVDRKTGSRLLHGLIGLGAGTAAFLWPGLREFGIANIFSAYVILTGALQVFTALDLYRVIRFDYYLVASGLLSIACGLWLKTAPVDDVQLLARIFGLFMTTYAVIFIGFALETKRLVTGPES